MAPQSEVNDTEYCPACRTFPWDGIPPGMRTSHLEFHLDDALMIQLMDQDIDKRFSTECYLYRIVRSLYDVWLGKKGLPAAPEWSPKLSQTYCPTGERAFTLFAEPGSAIGKGTTFVYIYKSLTRDWE
jgi:hypothetical protein